jgi:hypothetical protein
MRPRRSAVKDVICALGMVAMLSHACLAIILVPLYFVEHRPEAPISRFFAYCHLHCGGPVFWVFYFALLFGFFVWSIMRYANLPKRNRA